MKVYSEIVMMMLILMFEIAITNLIAIDDGYVDDQNCVHKASGSR